tara:strand:+ start:78 stop:302 length:225 start_codon:yes stop_codon:yes gene_type:complete
MKYIYKIAVLIIQMWLIVLLFNYIILPSVDNWANDVPTDECVSSHEENMELFPIIDPWNCDNDTCRCNGNYCSK